jgi:hypothetical protein
MSKPGLINLETTNTFQNWLDSTNELIVLLKTDVLTASALGDSTTGNATLVGTFSANTLIASETLRVNSVEAIGSLSNPIIFRSPITANTSGPATFTHSSVAGPRSLFTNSTVTWQIGFESAANTNFVITTGSGEPRFKVESNGTVTANAFKAVTLEGNLLGSANNSINLGGQPSSFYTNANNISSGTLSTDRLSGTYGINISGNAATATNATTANNASNLGGESPSFYEPRIPSGTTALFVQSTAPTGWTKSTAHNNKALRVVSGTAGSGGSIAFTSAFTSQAVSGIVGFTTLTEAQMPSHQHGGNTNTVGDHEHFVVSNGDGDPCSGPTTSTSVRTGRFFEDLCGQDSRVAYNLMSGFNQANGGRSSPSGAHAHSITTDFRGGNQGHNHTFSGTAIDLNVQYVDVIIATRN